MNIFIFLKPIFKKCAFLEFRHFDEQCKEIFVFEKDGYFLYIDFFEEMWFNFVEHSDNGEKIFIPEVCYNYFDKRIFNLLNSS